VLARVWHRQRTLNPPSTAVLFHLAFAGIRTGALLRHATLRDWFRFLLGVCRRPGLFWRTLQFRRDHAEVWQVLRLGAARRTAEHVPDPTWPPTFSKWPETSRAP
jgi:hypothetical protein